MKKTNFKSIRFDNSRLKRLRVEHDITKKALAKELGLSVPSIYRWETGKSIPSLIDIYKIAIFFNKRIEKFLIIDE